MSNVVQLHALSWDHLKHGLPVPVVRLDCETFYVQARFQPMRETRRRRGAYIVRNRTHFLGGQRVVDTLEEVRQIIRRA